ncbi:MAG: hypothetical protein ABI281_04365 [Caldimonas sp.]
MPQPSTKPTATLSALPASCHARKLARAEDRGKQILLYAPHGPLGGVFACSRCGAGGLQPDVLDHRADCLYRSGRHR